MTVTKDQRFRRHLRTKKGDPLRRFTLRILLRDPSPNDDPLFIGGNLPALGNWHPGKVRLQKDSPLKYSIQFEAGVDDVVEFKISRGSWKTQAIYDEVNAQFPPENRFLTGDSEPRQDIPIIDWLDTLSSSPDPVQGSLEVHPDFPSPGLNYPHDLYVWLPPSYAKSRKSYPVLYMHDGQNLFDPSQSFCGQDWKVDEVCTRLMKTGKIKEFIVVGVANSPDRMAEYNLFKAPGQKYTHFLIHKVKPFIDSTYRTLPKAENTAVMGSSMGGLYSFQLAWHFPEVFSMAGCLSSAFLQSRGGIFPQVMKDPHPMKGIRLYLDAGDQEQSFVKPFQKMSALLVKLGYREGFNLFSHLATDANHSESAWSRRLHLPLKFFFGTQSR